MIERHRIAVSKETLRNSAGDCTLGMVLTSERELQRIEVLSKVVERRITSVAAAGVLGAHTTNRPYPPFDPMQVFAPDGAVQSKPFAGQIYGAKVESEMSIKTVDFHWRRASG